MDPSLRQRLAVIVAQQPDALAVSDATHSLTYATLLDEAARVAGALRARGLGPGDVVAASMVNSIELVTLFLGAMQLGVTWVGLNPGLGVERRRVLDRAEPALVVVDDGDDAAALSTAPVLRRSVWAAEASAAEPWAGDHDDLSARAAIAFTSGTSGAPKGVVLSLENILLPPTYLATTEDFRPPARVGLGQSASVLNLMIVAVLPALLAGAEVHFLPSLRSIDVAEQIAARGLTCASLPPTTYFDFATRDNIAPEQLRTFVHARCGGSALSETTRQAYRAKFGVEIVGTYGLTEAPTGVSAEPRGRAHVEGSSGRVAPYLRVVVLDDDGQSVSPGEVGEICLAAATEGPWANRYRFMLGYFEDEALTQERMRGGVLHTGDAGSLDADGNLFVHGRMSETITRGGVTIYPLELENAVAQHPGVAASAAVGLPDERLGEAVGLVLEPLGGVGLDLADVLAFCAERVAGYKLPDRLAVVEMLPRNAMGKVVKATLVDAPFVRASELRKAQRSS